jgi:hypothetical protein
MEKTIWLSTIQEPEFDGRSITNFHNMWVNSISDHITALTIHKNSSWFDIRPNIYALMKDDMYKMLDKTIFDHIMLYENMMYGDGYYIRSLLKNYIDEFHLYPYDGFVDVKMDIMAIAKRIMYVRCCEKLSQTKKDKTINKIVQSIRDIISHTNSCISSTYYNKILDTLVAEHMMRSLNNNAIAFNNVIHIKLTHDVSEYLFRYVMHMKPDITSPTMDDKTRRFYDKI